MNKKMLSKIKFLVTVIIVFLFIWFLMVSPMITFHSNENKVKEAAQRYFELNNNKLPTGERVRTLSLSALYNESYLKEDIYVPYSNKTCSISKSWVKVRKDNNGDYQYLVYLECGVLKSSVDHEGPKITINGDEKITLSVGEKYTEPGVKSVVDANDGKISVENVVTKGNVNTNKVGTYTISYTALDSLNNKSTVTREVEVIQTLYSTIKNDLGDRNNYSGEKFKVLRLSNMYFYVYGINEDKKNIKVISIADIANVNHNKIDDWLKYYYDNLNDFTKKHIVKSRFCNMNVDENSYDSTECSGYSDKKNIYIPSVVEINRSYEGSSNYLLPTTMSWLANKKDDKEAYLTRDVFYGEYYGYKFLNYPVDENYGVRPMFVLDGSLQIKKGEGTMEKPYEFGDTPKLKGGQKLSERYTGEYVTINGVVYRVIKPMNNGTTKVISTITLGKSLEDPVKVYQYGEKNNYIYNPKDKNSVAYFINNGATEFVDTSKFVNGEFEVPIYKNKIVYGREVKTEKYTAKVFAPNMYEMFSAKPYFDPFIIARTNSYWLVNSVNNKKIGGVISDTGCPINEELADYSKFGVRVVAYVKSNVVVTSGDGTYYNPFKIK